MFEKLVTQAAIFASTFNQTGDVGEEESADSLRFGIVVDNADLRMQGRKGIGSGLRASPCDRGRQGRLTRVREANKADIGDAL